MQRAPPPTGEPGKAPASYTRCASAAVIRPFLVAPIFTVTSPLEVGPVAMKTSIRLMAIFTGLPVFRDRTAATGSRYTPPLPFPPNPPPISMGITLTLDVGMPSIFEVSSRTLKSCWVLVHTVTYPSVPHITVEACGSMYP